MALRLLIRRPYFYDKDRSNPNSKMVKLINKINKIVEYICIFLMFTLFSLLTVGVIARYIFNSPIIWQYELIQVLFVWLMFLGGTVAFFDYQHITIKFFVNALPQIARNLSKNLVSLSIFIFGVIVIKEGFMLVQAFSSRNFRTVPISIGWLYAAPPVSFILILFYDIVLSFLKQDKIKNKHKTNKYKLMEKL